MKYTVGLLLCALAPVLAPAASTVQEEPPAPSASDVLESMTWLTGTWECEIWGGTFHSNYGTPAGGVLLSASKLLVKEQAVFFEFELFRVQEGTLVMVPHPEGEAQDPFEMTEFDLEARKVVFENPANDYPSRITYHGESDERLVITLDDPHHESERRDVFQFEPAP